MMMVIAGLCPASVLRGEDVHSLQQVQGQAVLGVVFWQHLDETAHQSAGLLQRNQGTPQFAGVLQHTQVYSLETNPSSGPQNTCDLSLLAEPA